MLEQQPQLKATIMKRLVQGMVISKIARDKMFDARQDIKEQIDLMTNDFLAREYLKKEVLGGVQVTEEEARLYYKTHLDKFRTPETIKLSQIMVKVQSPASAEEKEKAKKKAEEILKRAKTGEDFAKLASEMSDDLTSKAKGGSLGILIKGKMIPEFEEATASLKPGEMSDVVQTSFGYHIIKVEERKEAILEPFDKVKDQAREMAMDEFKTAKAEEFINKAMKDAKVEIYVDRLPGAGKKAAEASK
jgi:parvulin-like peptidyl-prolyl isomerase